MANKLIDLAGLTTYNTKVKARTDNLQEQINNLKARGRFLSTWNGTTGKPADLPGTIATEAYTYKTGDYFIVNVAGNKNPSIPENNTIPAGTTLENWTYFITGSDVAVNDTIYFTNNTWSVLHTPVTQTVWGGIGGTLSEQTDLQNALNEKVVKTTTINGHTLNNNVTITKSDVSLGDVVNTSDSDTPISGGTTKFTTGGAYTELNKKIDKVSTANKVYGTDANGNQTTYDKNSFGQVEDVKVDNISVVTNKVANINLTSKSNATNIENGTGVGSLKQHFIPEPDETEADAPTANGRGAVSFGKRAHSNAKRSFSHGSYINNSAHTGFASGQSINVYEGANASWNGGVGIENYSPYTVVFGQNSGNDKTTVRNAPGSAIIASTSGVNGLVHGAVFGVAETVTNAGESSIVAGYGNEVNHSNKDTVGNPSIVLGKYLVSNKPGEIVFGKFNSNKENTVLEIGNGYGTEVYQRSNAFEVLQDGRAKVFGAPTENDDVVRKQELDTKSSATNLENGDGLYSLAQIRLSSEGEPRKCSAYQKATAAFGGNTQAGKTFQEWLVDNPSGTQEQYNAIYSYAFAEGQATKARGTASHAEGNSAQANGDTAHAEGSETVAGGERSHAEGYRSQANGDNSHAEGEATQAVNASSHAEGAGTVCSGYASHTEGGFTQTNNQYAHAEGYYTEANGLYSHASGCYTKANSSQSCALGYHTVANTNSQLVTGNFNIGRGTTLLEIGNGTADDARSNAFEVYQDGTAKIGAMGTDSLSVATKQYVDSHSCGTQLYRHRYEIDESGSGMYLNIYSSLQTNPINNNVINDEKVFSMTLSADDSNAIINAYGLKFEDNQYFLIGPFTPSGQSELIPIAGLFNYTLTEL